MLPSYLLQVRNRRQIWLRLLLLRPRSHSACIRQGVLSSLLQQKILELSACTCSAVSVASVGFLVVAISLSSLFVEIGFFQRVGILTEILSCILPFDGYLPPGQVVGGIINRQFIKKQRCTVQEDNFSQSGQGVV